MNNDRGQSLHIPSITSLKENNIYVATLHFMTCEQREDKFFVRRFARFKRT